ncbi:MAG: c-type cytochrome biogenesis protein CcmI, partial [Gammaproteobacteria bacterium]
LGELKADFEAGAITEAEFEEGKAELETSLATDLDEKAAPTLAGAKASPVTAVLTALVTIGLTVGLYAYLGTPEGLDVKGPGKPEPVRTASGKEMPSIDEMVAKLAAKLEEQPNNVDGWFMLGRSYGVMERWADAVGAYRRAYSLSDDQPQIMINLAEAIAMSSEDGLQGEPTELLLKAVELDPNSVPALWFLGLASVDAQDYDGAVSYWRRILPQLADDPQGKAELEKTIAEAEALARGDAPGAMAESAESSATAGGDVVQAAKVEVNVSLDGEVTGGLASNDTVFIFARAVQGPPMPLAVARVTVADLPIQVTLDDSMAMMPQMAISNFPEVLVQARVSLSGRPTAEPGDVQSEAVAVKVGEAVSLTIDSKVE